MNIGWKTREQMEATERATLAPFAQKSGESRGRKYPEQSHAYRTEFQRNRARIIHSRMFRRLEYKTQVFLNGTGDQVENANLIRYVRQLQMLGQRLGAGGGTSPSVMISMYGLDSAKNARPMRMRPIPFAMAPGVPRFPRYASSGPC